MFFRRTVRNARSFRVQTRPTGRRNELLSHTRSVGQRQERELKKKNTLSHTYVFKLTRIEIPGLPRPRILTSATRPILAPDFSRSVTFVRPSPSRPPTPRRRHPVRRGRRVNRTPRITVVHDNNYSFCDGKMKRRKPLDETATRTREGLLLNSNGLPLPAIL